VERVFRLAHRPGMGRKVGVARRREGDRLVAEAADDVLELDAGGAEPHRRGIGDVVGDGVEALFERDLRGKGDVKSVLHVSVPIVSVAWRWRASCPARCRTARRRKTGWWRAMRSSSSSCLSPTCW